MKKIDNNNIVLEEEIDSFLENIKEENKIQDRLRELKKQRDTQKRQLMQIDKQISENIARIKQLRSMTSPIDNRSEE